MPTDPFTAAERDEYNVWLKASVEGAGLPLTEFNVGNWENENLNLVHDKLMEIKNL